MSTSQTPPDPDLTGHMKGEPPGEHQSAKAAASAWIGSALEYYDYFIYAAVAGTVFPQVFFPEGDDNLAMVAAMATFGVGYVARPIGAFVLGHLGDTIGRKKVLLFCMYVIGLSTMAVAFLPTYHQVGIISPILLVTLRLIQGFAVAGEISGASSMVLEHAPYGRRGFFGSFTLQGVQAGQILAAGVFIPLATFLSDEAFTSWGWRIPFVLSFFVVIAGVIIRRTVHETPAFEEEVADGVKPDSPIIQAFRYSWPNMLRVMCMALMNTIPIVATTFGSLYATQAAYGIEMEKRIYFWIPLLGNLLAVLVIPMFGHLSDRIGRRPVMIGGCLLSGLSAFGYLKMIEQDNVVGAILMSLLMWGFFYQGYNAVFPAFYPELFPTKTRVSGMAISQNTGTTITAALAPVFAAVAQPGTNVPLIVGAMAFGVTVLSALAAFSAKETYRLHVNDLGTGATPPSKEEYERLRTEAMAEYAAAKSGH
ncbi:MAG: MFS transporter [Actinomycetales bacterium]